MRQSRRVFIASLAVFGGGCLSSRSSSKSTAESDRDSDGVPDTTDDYPTDDRRAYRSFQIDGTETLQPGQFSAVALTNSPQASGDVLHYDINVDGNTEVDCLVFEREAYDAYQNGDREVSIVSKYSRTGITETTVTQRLDQGEYIFSLDYTDLVTDPNETSVTVTRSLELGEPADE